MENPIFEKRTVAPLMKKNIKSIHYYQKYLKYIIDMDFLLK